MFQMEMRIITIVWSSLKVFRGRPSKFSHVFQECIEVPSYRGLLQSICFKTLVEGRTRLFIGNRRFRASVMPYGGKARKSSGL